MLIACLLLGIYLLCTLAAPILGTAQAAGAAVLEGAQEAVRFCLGLAGGICLWSGVLELLERC
ncbi:MAG: spore maturation protein A, partial [Oscillospiraceae bacterium]|nr:spore maturation protein A [Oscillospiraceae bacterium]